MIVYKLRPPAVPVKIDNELKTITNVLNMDVQKAISHMTAEAYYNTIITESENWPSITEEEFNTAKAEVLALLA